MRMRVWQLCTHVCVHMCLCVHARVCSMQLCTGVPMEAQDWCLASWIALPLYSRKWSFRQAQRLPGLIVSVHGSVSASATLTGRSHGS